jgi:LacI family transcriptional regulator
MRVTIADIAKHCNVSEGTVDRALNNRFGISEKTKERILAAAQELNYLPNHTARSLATGRTMTIGIVCFDLFNNFFPELIDTIEVKAKEKGYFIHLILSHKDLKTEKEGLEYLFSRHVDGVILFPIGVSDDFRDYLNKMKVPIVTIYNKISDDFSYIGVDDSAAMSDAVEYIAQKKYNQIIYLTPSIKGQKDKKHNVYTLEKRKQGYLNGIKKVENIKEAIVMEGKPAHKELDMICNMLSPSLKTALLCSCDSYALEAMEYLREKGISIPEDLGLMGYDDITMLKFIKPRLTTIRYSVQKMGEVIFDMLYKHMNTENITASTLLEYEIVEGETII